MPSLSNLASEQLSRIYPQTSQPTLTNPSIPSATSYDPYRSGVASGFPSQSKPFSTTNSITGFLSGQPPPLNFTPPLTQADLPVKIPLPPTGLTGQNGQPFPVPQFAPAPTAQQLLGRYAPNAPIQNNYVPTYSPPSISPTIQTQIRGLSQPSSAPIPQFNYPGLTFGTGNGALFSGNSLLGQLSAILGLQSINPNMNPPKKRKKGEYPQQQPGTVQLNAAPSDQQMLSAALQGEQNTPQGMQNTADTIYNRTQGNQTGGSDVMSVLAGPGQQYQATYPGYNDQTIQALQGKTPQWQQDTANQLASQLLAGTYKPSTNYDQFRGSNFSNSGQNGYVTGNQEDIKNMKNQYADLGLWGLIDGLVQ